MKTIGVTQRVFRDPTPQFPIRHKDRRREDDRPQREPSVKFLYGEVPEGRGQRTMNTVPMPMLGTSSSPPVDEGSMRISLVLGVISLVFLGQCWLVSSVSTITGLLNWRPEFLGPVLEWSRHSFPVSLIGVHLFGIMSSSLSGGQRQLGSWSIGLFWLGVIGVVTTMIMMRVFGW